MDWVLISFVAYTLVILVLGLLSGWVGKHSSRDFFLADSGLGAWVGALSAAASAESGWVTLGLVGMAYKTGIGALWVVAGTFAAFLFNWFVLAWRLRKRSDDLGSITLPGILADHFTGWASRLIRLTAVLTIAVMLTAYIASQLNAAGKCFLGTFAWDYRLGVLLGGGLVAAYTVTGGFRAIAWSDVIQSILMIGTMTLVPVLLVWHTGGPVAFGDAVRQIAIDQPGYLDPLAGNSGLAAFGFLLLWLGIPAGNPGQPHVIIRFMAIRDRQSIFRAGLISSTWVLVLFTGAVLLGIAARVYFGNLADPEQALPKLATESALIPGFIGGAIVAAILAAICSTADSQLLVVASSVSYDLPRLVSPSSDSAARGKGLQQDKPKSDGRPGQSPATETPATVWLHRGVVLLVAAIGCWIALQEVQSVFKFVLDYGWAGLGAGFGPALLAVLLLRKWVTGWGVWSGMVAGPVVVVLWKWIPGSHQQFYSLVPALVISGLAIFLVSLFGPAAPGPSDKTESSAPTS